MSARKDVRLSFRGEGTEYLPGYKSGALADVIKDVPDVLFSKSEGLLDVSEYICDDVSGVPVLCVPKHICDVGINVSDVPKHICDVVTDLSDALADVSLHNIDIKLDVAG